MGKNHLKTIAAPKTWPVSRKSKVFILRPNAGPHSLDKSLTLNFVLIDILKLAKTKREAKYLLSNKDILVDQVKRKDRAFPVGLFDVISIKDIGKNYRVINDSRGKLNLIEIDEKDAMLKPCKVIGKHIVKNKMQLNFFDGKNTFVDKGKYNVGDTVLIDLKTKKIDSHIKLEKGTTIFLTSGKHTGSIGTVEDIEGSKIIYKRKDGTYQTLKEYAYVIGQDKAAIKIE